MAASRAGIRSITLTKKGTLANPIVEASMFPIYIGIRGAATQLLITDHNTTEDYLGRTHRNMLNFKAEPESKQIEIAELDGLLTFIKDGGCDAQLVAVENGVAGGSVFNLVGESFAGIGFEYENSNKERKCKILLEVAQEYDVAKSIISSAAAPTIAAISNNPLFNKVVPPYLTSIVLAGDYTISKQDLKEWKLTLKTSGDKSTYNRDIVSYLDVILEFTSYKADVATIVNLLGKSNFPSVALEQKNLPHDGIAPSANNRFIFNAGTLGMKNEPKIGDDERSVKVTLAGKVPIDNIVKSSVTDYAVLNFSN